MPSPTPGSRILTPTATQSWVEPTGATDTMPVDVHVANYPVAQPPVTWKTVRSTSTTELEYRRGDTAALTLLPTPGIGDAPVTMSFTGVMGICMDPNEYLYCKLAAPNEALYRFNGATWDERYPASGDYAQIEYLDAGRTGKLYSSGNQKVYIIDVSTKVQTLLFEPTGGTWPAGMRADSPLWSPQGTLLVVVHREGTLSAAQRDATGIYEIDGDSGAVIGGPHQFGYTWSTGIHPQVMRRDQSGGYWCSVDGLDEAVLFDPGTMNPLAAPVSIDSGLTFYGGPRMGPVPAVGVPGVGGYRWRLGYGPRRGGYH